MSNESVLSVNKDMVQATKQASLAVLEKFQPTFELKVGLCATYNDLLRGRCEDAHDIPTLLQAIHARGRLILSGKGGAGKTGLARRIAIAALGQGDATVVISLRNWGKAAGSWAEKTRAPSEIMDFILCHLADSKVTVSNLRQLPANERKLVIVDGLNEVPANIAQTIIDSCDDLAATVVQLSVIVVDRLVRRKLVNEARWLYAMPKPLSAEAISHAFDQVSAAHVGNYDKLLQSPFCLDAALKGDSATTPLKVIEGLVTQHGIEQASIEPTARAAFEMYVRGSSRAFEYEEFAELSGNDVAAKLLASGLLQKDANIASFSHHWFHDFFASQHVAAHSELWTNNSRQSTFNALTFDGNSFDAVGFVLELLAREDCDGFIQAVYDWNPYAAGYALAELDGLANGVLSPDIRTIVLAMLAERMFDRNVATATRAKDALSLFRTDDAKNFIETGSLEQLISNVATLRFETVAAQRWQSLFTREPTSRISDLDLHVLTEDNSIEGWTLANVLKRLDLTPSQIEWLIKRTKDLRMVVRWRAVHALGAFPARKAADRLSAVLRDDTEEQVRYGAVRSLVEMASRADTALRSHIVSALIKRIHAIKSSQSVLRELQASAFIAPSFAPHGWGPEMARVFNALIDDADNMPDIERWAGVAARISKLGEQPSSAV